MTLGRVDTSWTLRGQTHVKTYPHTPIRNVHGQIPSGRPHGAQRRRVAVPVWPFRFRLQNLL